LCVWEGVCLWVWGGGRVCEGRTPHTHTHAHAHTHTHKCSHHTRMQAHTYTPTHTSTCTDTNTYTHSHVHKSTSIPTIYPNTHSHVQPYTHIHTHLHGRVNVQTAGQFHGLIAHNAHGRTVHARKPNDNVLCRGGGKPDNQTTRRVVDSGADVIPAHTGQTKRAGSECITKVNIVCHTRKRKLQHKAMQRHTLVGKQEQS